MTNRASMIREIFDRLTRAYGPRGWWPGETAAEVVIGAILTQNTAWANVERAIANLKSEGALDFAALCDLSYDRLCELIRPAGTYRVKAGRLRALGEVLRDEHNGSLDAMLTGDLAEVRERLLAIRGIGPETADAILLYAGGRASFVIDRYTRRLLRRHFLILKTEADRYNMVQSVFHAALGADAAVFNEYHALLVEVGKRHCRRRANCCGCPLADMPHDERL